MSNLEKYYRENKDELDPLIIKALEEKFGGRTVFFGGFGVYLGNPTNTKDFTSFCYSKAKLTKLLKDSSITVKASMSHKVDLLVWSGHSFYHKGEFDKYEASKHRIDHNQFFQPMIDVIYKDYKKILNESS